MLAAAVHRSSYGNSVVRGQSAAFPQVKLEVLSSRAVLVLLLSVYVAIGVDVAFIVAIAKFQQEMYLVRVLWQWLASLIAFLACGQWLYHFYYLPPATLGPMNNSQNDDETKQLTYFHSFAGLDKLQLNGNSQRSEEEELQVPTTIGSSSNINTIDQSTFITTNETSTCTSFEQNAARRSDGETKLSLGEELAVEVEENVQKSTATKITNESANSTHFKRKQSAARRCAGDICLSLDEDLGDEELQIPIALKPASIASPSNFHACYKSSSTPETNVLSSNSMHKTSFKSEQCDSKNDDEIRLSLNDELTGGNDGVVFTRVSSWEDEEEEEPAAAGVVEGAVGTYVDPRCQRRLIQFFLFTFAFVNITITGYASTMEYGNRVNFDEVHNYTAYFLTTGLMVIIVVFLIILVASFRTSNLLPRDLLVSIYVLTAAEIVCSIVSIVYAYYSSVGKVFFYTFYILSLVVWIIFVCVEVFRTRIFLSKAPYATTRINQMAYRLCIFQGLPLVVAIFAIAFLLNGKFGVLTHGGLSVSTWIFTISYSYLPLNRVDLQNMEQKIDHKGASKCSNFSLYNCILAFYGAHASYFDPPDQLTVSNKGILYEECPVPSFLSLIKFISIDKYDCQCSIFYSSICKSILVALRGTSSINNAKSDLKLSFVPYTSHSESSEMLKFKNKKLLVHSGFYNAYNSIKDSILIELKQAILDFDCTGILVSGHSLGGAIGCFLSVDLHFLFPNVGQCSYLFGSPRLGNLSFCEFVDEVTNSCFRVVFERDPIPYVPKGFGYNHPGVECLLDRYGTLIVDPSDVEHKLLRQTVRRKDHKRFSYAVGLRSLVANVGLILEKGNNEKFYVLKELLDCVDVALKRFYSQTNREYRGVTGHIVKYLRYFMNDNQLEGLQYYRDSSTSFE